MKRLWLAVLLAAGMALAGAVLAFYLHQAVKDQVVSQFNESQQLIAQQAAEYLKSYLEARADDLRALASLSSVQQIDGKTMLLDVQAAFDRLKTRSVTDIFVLDSAGRRRYSAAGDAGGSQTLPSEIQAWPAKPTGKGEVRLLMAGSDAADKPQLVLTTPLYREFGVGGSTRPDAPTGLLALTVDLKSLAERTPLFASAAHGPSSIWIMNDDGTLLLQSQHPAMVSRNIREHSAECRQCHVSFDYAEQMLTAKQGVQEYQLRGEPSKVAAFAPMSFANASWLVVVNASKERVTGFVQSNFVETMALFGVVGVVVGLTVLAAYRGSQQDVIIAEKVKHLQEKEQLIQDLREAREYLENLFDSANAPIIVWNPELRITKFNQACERLTGYTAGEAIGLELKALFPEQSRDDSVDKIVRASSREDRDSPEIPILRKDGRIRIALWNAANIRSGDGTAVIATIAQGQDITERKQAEQMKADFVSFVTHQLRTPLSGIRWLLELAGEDDKLSEEAASLIIDARLSAERLIALVNDLLAVTRIEAGRLAVEREPVDLSAVTSDVIEEMTPLIRDKRHRITVSEGAPEPLVYADPKLLREVVLNLLSNAIKYTPNDGSITVSMRANGDWPEWSVRDTGIGIPEAARPHLFEKFYRAGNASIANTEGTGLGLYLTRLILERMGGRVWCEPEEDRGSTFTFTLPAAKRAAQSGAS